MAVVSFPVRVRTSPATSGATPWQIWQSRLRAAAGAFFNWIGLPGAVKSVEIVDGVTGQRIEIRVTSQATRISIDGRDFYFDRLTGKPAGTGSRCA